MPATIISFRMTCICVVVILLCASCRQEQRYHYISDLEQGLINGPVTWMHTLEYESSDCAGEDIPVQETIELFNEHGSSPSDTVNYFKTGDQEINVLYFHPNTSLREKQTFINGKLETILKGTYTESGQFTRVDFINGKDSLLEYYLIDSLSPTGSFVAARHFSPHGVLLDSFRNIFNDFTRISARNFDTTGQVIYQDTVEVNEYNRPVQEINWMRANGELIRDTVIHHYDSLDHYGNWKIHTVTSKQGKPVRFVRKYKYKISG